MTHLARRLGLFDLPLVASLAVPAWAAGPVGLGYLKMGMSKSAIEQGDSSGAIKLLDPLQELKLPTKAPVADDYYTTQAVLPFSPDPVKLSLGFKGDSLSVIVTSRTIIWPLVKKMRVRLMPLFHGLHRRTALER